MEGAWHNPLKNLAHCLQGVVENAFGTGIRTCKHSYHYLSIRQLQNHDVKLSQKGSQVHSLASVKNRH